MVDLSFRCQVGLLHPSLKYAFQPGPFFETPKKYLATWLARLEHGTAPCGMRTRLEVVLFGVSFCQSREGRG